MDGGIIPLWKEKGIYSQDYITKLRKLLGIKKVGHSGTLDPDVDGVLPVAFGVGTKVLEYMLDSDKKYQGQVCIGYSTTTEDASGKVLDQQAVKPDSIRKEEVDALLDNLQGSLIQIPPMYSAVRFQGQRLYDLARQGIEVDRPSRQVEIYDLQRSSDLLYDEDQQTLTFSFDVTCSKGTYIRTLAVEMGKRLAYPAHLSALTRIESAGLIQADCVTFSQLEEAKATGHWYDHVLPLEDFLTDFDQVELSEALKDRVKNGAQLSLDNFVDQSVTYPALLIYKGQAIALYEENEKRPGWLKPKKMIRS